MNFEWDPQKADKNLSKHGVSFAEAGTVFGDELAITVPDPDHSTEEDRFIIVGWSNPPQVIDCCARRPRRPHPNYQCA